MAVLKALEDTLILNNIQYKKEVPLSSYTSFKIGGTCPIMAIPADEGQVGRILSACFELGLSYLIVGNGSNMLVSDEGFDGVCILLNQNFSKIALEDDTTIRAQAGVTLARLCTFAWEHSLTGLEFAYGIPATVGGAVYMNAGAYGGEMKDVLKAAAFIDEEGNRQILPTEQLQMSYRHSAFTSRNCCITQGIFQLQKGDKQKIREAMDDIYGRRKQKQPLEFPSAGSTFKRPANAFAAKLIEDCGLKGKQVGGAMVSTKHSGFVINTGGATCADVQELIRQVQAEVKRQTDIDLECEVKLIK